MRLSADHSHAPKARVIGYGSGDFAFNLTFTFCSLFLLYFYTDVLGLSATTGGLIIMVALIWEGATDPVVGILANRTRSRWGRYRPYLLFGCVPLALSFVAMFVPIGLTGLGLTGYAFATHILFRTIYTLVNIPYVALSAQMTTDSNVRGQLAGARMMFAISCGLTLAALSLPLVSSFGGGQQGFFWLSLIYGAVAIVVLLTCFASTREVVGEVDDHPSLREMTRSVRENRPFLLLLGAVVLGSIGSTMASKAMLYYMKYYAGDESAVTTGLTISLGTAALALLPWLIVTKRTSKRFVWLSGTVISGSVSLAIFVFAPKVGLLLWALLAVGGVGSSAFFLTFWSMVPDTVEYGEWRTGTRAEGAVVGLMIFSQKMALGLGTGLIGILLDAIGYLPNEVQSPGTLDGIRVMYALVPLILSLSAGALIWFYPLDQETHARLVREIGERRLQPTRMPKL